MACNYSSVLIVLLAVFAAAAHGQPYYTGLTVRGELCCTPTGNCPGRPVATENIGVYSGPFQLGSNCTNDNGMVIINITRRVTALEAAGYMAVAELPTSSRVCADLSVLHGRLIAPLMVTGGVGGYLQATISQFAVNATQ